MKRFFYVRFFYLIVLMVLSSSAYAGHSFSFVVGRHRVRIEAPRHCHSPSCLSVSIPEIRETLDRYDAVEATPATAMQAKSPAAAPDAVSPRPGVSPAVKSSIDPVASVPAPTSRVELAAAATRDVATPVTSNIQPSRLQPATPTPPATQPPTDAARSSSGRRFPDFQDRARGGRRRGGNAARRLADRRQGIGSHRAMRPRAVRACPQSIVKRQW